MTDLQAYLQYLLTIELLGLAAWPLTRRLLTLFPDKGWGLSKIVGLLLASYLTWLLGSLKLVPFTPTNLLIVSTAMALIIWLPSILNFQASRPEISGSIPWQLMLFEELLFIGAFAIWSYVRTFAPDIHGLEKYMDYGFMLSILRSKYFPPLDHFLARESINYYYFGHLMAAIMSRLSQVPAQIAYNLQMNLLFGLTMLESFVLGSTLYTHSHQLTSLQDQKKKIQKWYGAITTRQVFAGILAATFVTLTGNLHTIFYWPKEGNNYWYPDATRFIEHTIHEFPIYSFVVNDLHGHVSDLPVVLLIISLLFSYFALRLNNSNSQESTSGNSKKGILFTLAFTIGLTYAINAWDFMIYLVLIGLIFLLTEFLVKFWESSTHDTMQTVQKAVPKAVLKIAVVLPVAIFLMLPYWLTVKPIGKGVGIVPLGEQSPLWQLAILWGFHVVLGLLFILWFFRGKIKLKLKAETLVELLASILGVKISLITKESLQPKTRNRRIADIFAVSLLLWGFTLLILPEMIYVKDIYPTYYRANTMFKFTYQAFVMMGVALGYAVVRMWTKLKTFRFPFRLLTAALIFSVSLYPLKAIDSGFGGLKSQYKKSLDGTAYLETQRPSDAQAIDWINENILGQPTFVEAVGDSYTDYARIAANTGIPVVLGWPVHEWLWRGSYGDPMQPTTQLERATSQPDTVAQRVENVKGFYETESVEEARQFLQKYNVDYIYVGELEREKYPDLNEGKLSTLAEPVYQNSTVTIYKTDDRLER